MNAEQTLTLGASGAFLALAALCALRAKRSPLATPTALLCVDLFAYNSLEFLGNLTRERHWEWLESASAALAAPLLFHLTLAFLGARRQKNALLLGAYVYFGAIALSCLAPFVIESMAGYPGQDQWAMVMLGGVAPTFAYAATGLVAHYKKSGSADERARTQLFIGTVTIGVGGPATDLAAIAGASSAPRLAAASMLVSALFLCALALRAKLLRGTLALLAANAVVIGVVGVVAHLLVYRWLGSETALLVVGTVTVTLILLGAARSTWTDFAEYRERTSHLATLGRLSAQMAHDIRNPLAAIHGAAQYLDEERKRGGTLEESAEFLALILEQTARLERVVQDYRRLGRAEPSSHPTDVEALVRAVVQGAKLASGEGLEIVADVDVDGPAHLDPELVSTALENLERNAVEALEGAGTVIVRARSRGVGPLVIDVSDDGPGMDARTREQAEDAFFTTKAQGSGLGLAFVRRVAEAHGGAMRVESALGHGTTVFLELPAAARASDAPARRDA